MALAPFFSASSNVWDPFPSFFEPVDILRLEIGPALALARDAYAVAGTRVDWVETPEAHVLKADLPGLKKEQVKVEIEDGNVLKISGSRSHEEVKKTDKWHQVERSHGQFLRQFRLPADVDLDKIAAKVENGVLSVTIPKVEKQKPEVRPVDIQE